MVMTPTARVVLVVHAEQRRVGVHRAGAAPFDGLILDWDSIYEGIDLSRW